MWSMRWASYWLIYVTNGSIVIAKWSSSPSLSSRHGCPNQMWATSIMKLLLFATSVVLTWLPQSDVSNRYHEDTGERSSSLRLLSRHGCPNQTWSNMDQRTVTLLQRMNSNQHLIKFLSKGLIVVSEDCTLLLIILQVRFYLNIVETVLCTFFREYIVIFEHSFFTVGMQ
jgi:hypothetical protein